MKLKDLNKKDLLIQKPCINEMQLFENKCRLCSAGYITDEKTLNYALRDYGDYEVFYYEPFSKNSINLLPEQEYKEWVSHVIVKITRDDELVCVKMLDKIEISDVFNNLDYEEQNIFKECMEMLIQIIKYENKTGKYTASVSLDGGEYWFKSYSLDYSFKNSNLYSYY